jgi:hypothetical protein
MRDLSEQPAQLLDDSSTLRLQQYNCIVNDCIVLSL